MKWRGDAAHLSELSLSVRLRRLEVPGELPSKSLKLLPGASLLVLLLVVVVVFGSILEGWREQETRWVIESPPLRWLIHTTRRSLCSKTQSSSWRREGIQTKETCNCAASLLAYLESEGIFSVLPQATDTGMMCNFQMGGALFIDWLWRNWVTHCGQPRQITKLGGPVSLFPHRLLHCFCYSSLF